MGDISDSYDIDVIGDLGVGLTEDEAEELDNLLVEVIKTRLQHEEQAADMASVEEIVVSIASMSFVAGRAYQADQVEQGRWNVSMPRKMQDLFIEFLVDRVQV